LIRSIETTRLTELWRQYWTIDIASELADLARIDLWGCESCYLQFFTPTRTADASELYGQLEKFEWYYMPHKWEHDVALTEIRAGQSLLEVGCGFGDFVALLREQGVQAEGIEVNASAVSVAQGRGLPIQQTDLRDFTKLHPRHYDVVCAFQVLEHVPNPKEFIQWSCAALKPGGKLLLGVPNGNSFLKHQFNLLDMPPHHMTRWSSQVMAYLPNLFPVRLQQIRYEPLAEYHVAGYVDAHVAAFLGTGQLYRAAAGALIWPISVLLRKTGWYSYLTGQTLYVSFTRV
jgi:2-polyprenyl-3-methyl-5-hydroxy-6-metoxy-1,4-benzoquinol methylase